MSMQEPKEDDIPDGYTECSSAALDTQRDVTTNFLRKLWPPQTGGELYSSGNFRARQYADGSGYIRHYRTKETVRTKNDLILVNSQCHDEGFAKCSPPRGDVDTEHLPIDFIETLAPGHATIRDVYAVHRNNDGILVRFSDSEEDVFVGQDETQHDATWFGFTVEGVHTPEEALHTLKPSSVYAAEQEGLDVKRQGEWWLIPTEPEAQYPIRKCLNVPNRKHDWNVPNFSYMDIDGEHNSLPKYCPECGCDDLQIHERAPIFECPGCAYRASYDSDLALDSLISSDLRDRYANARNELGSHTPRDLMLDDEDNIYVRGTFRHTPNEHYMLSLGDSWHRAVTHDHAVRTSDSGDRIRRD
ncbi:MAG: hypothetical protein ABEH81_01480 [Halopenitus sp.]